MTSLLATQLNRLSIPEGQNATADIRRRKSLIYNEIELNKVDAAAHLERAQKAFKHLVNIDSGLEQFFDCFFSEERVNFEPTMQTPDQKAALDQFIEHFLIRISQHLLLGVTLEVLEWLVYRFHIHLYNMDAMLQAVFPYHSTNLFPKFLQLFEFNSHNKRWHWLKPLANQGLPLVKSELVRMAARDEAVLNFPCNLVVRALKVFGPDEARLSLFVNLYAQVTLGVLMTPIDGKALTKCVNSLNFYIVKGLRSSLKCYRHSAYQIVQLLATKHQLNPTVLTIWMRRLLKSSCKYEPDEVCLLIALLCKTQNATVPQQLTSKFESVCDQCNSTVLNEFPEIVGRDTADVDVSMPEAVEAHESDAENDETEKRHQLEQLEQQKHEQQEQRRHQLEESIREILLHKRSPLTTVACLLTLLISRSHSVRHSSLECLTAAANSPEPGNEEDASIWSTVDTVLTNRQAIERDSQAALRPEVAGSVCRLLWRSLRDLLQHQPVTALQRRCMLAHLQYFNEACLSKCLSDGEDSSARQLARLINYGDACVAKAAAAKVSPKVFNGMSQQQKAVYLMEGLGLSTLTEESRVLKLAAAYKVDNEVYMDCLAELFCLVPSNPSIKSLSNRRKSCSSGNAYAQMGESGRRQVRFLFKLLLISETEAFEQGLQLVIKLLEVLKVLVQAHSQSHDSDSARDICLCLVCADKVAGLSEADNGLADQVPAQTALDCVRIVQNRQCQYAGIGLLCRLCERAPSCVSRCFDELVQFLVDSKFFSRSDSHTEQLWRLLLDSAVPPCANGVSLLRQLLSAYPDVPPSRRVDLYRQAVVALGSQDNLWTLLLLLNMRAAGNRRPRETSHSAGRKRRLSEQSEPQFGQYDQLGSSVLATFDAPLQLSSCARALDCLLAALGHRQPEAADSQLTLPKDEDELVGLLGGTLALVTSHLARKDLLIGIADNAASANAMTCLLRSLVDSLLWSSSSQCHRGLAAASVRAIEKAETAVPGAQFLQVVTELLQHEDAGVQRKSLDLLLGKLSGLDKINALRHLRHQLLTCLHALSEHTASQVGLICAKEVTRLLGAEEAKQVTQFCRRASQRCLQFESPNWELAGCCLLLNAEAVKQAGLSLLPVVVQTMPCLLDCLRQKQPPQVALMAAYAFIQQCVLSLYDLLVPYLPQLVPVTVYYLEDCAPQPQLAQKLRSVLTRLGKCVEFGQLAPVVLRCARSDTRHPAQYARLLRVGVQSVVAKSADSIEEFESELTDTFTLLLGAREMSLEQQETGVVQQLARCLLLLSRTVQSSLLQSLFDWCGTDSTRRQLPLYRMLHLAMGNNRQLAELLTEMEIGQRLAQLLEARPTDAESQQLLRVLLANLRQLVSSDALDIEQLEVLGRTMVGQLEVGDALDADTVADHLLPSLSELTNAAGGDETLLKPIVRSLCDLCQPECHRLSRYWSLRSLQSVANKLGEVFIDSLAADCVPILAECAEDDDEEIEALAQELLRDIEQKAGGEPMEL